MNYEAWRISYQSSEQAARAAYAYAVEQEQKIKRLEDELNKLRAKSQSPAAWSN